MLNLEPLIYKITSWAAKVLLAFYLATLILMGAVFPLFLNALVALPVEVSVIPAVQNKPAIVTLNEIIYDNATYREKAMALSGNNSWSGDSKTWIKAIIISAIDLKQVSTINVQIGTRQFSYSSDDIAKNWTASGNGSSVILQSPLGLKANGSKISRFNGFINWPGDGKFLIGALKRSAITLLVLLVVLGAMLFIYKTKHFWLSWFAKVPSFFSRHSFWWLALVVALGLATRIWVSFFGYAIDSVDAFKNGLIFHQGGNIYARTAAYNYGPIWFYILGFLVKISHYSFNAFKLALPSFISLADVGIFIVLLKKFGKAAAVVFFLNPISIINTGFGRQFDNLAILLALLAVISYGEDFSRGFDKRKIWGLILLGISLVIKHIFFAFPFWLAVKQKGVKEKVVVFFLPILIFFGSFLPYLRLGKQGIIHNVFLYQSLGGTAVLRLAKLVVGEARGSLVSTLLLFAALAVFGIIFKKYSGLKSVLLYTLVLLLFASSISANYLAIAAVAAAVFLNGFFVLYFLVSGFLLASNMLNLSNWPTGLLGFFLPTILLFMGFLELTAKDIFLKLKDSKFIRSFNAL